MIEFRNVYKTYDTGTDALNDMNLSVTDGEFVFIEGASGAGKSTLIKLLLCEERPTSGEIYINDFDLVHMPRRNIPKLRRTMGVVFQDFRLIQTMTVYDNVAFALRVVGSSSRAIRRRVPYILNLVGLADKARRYPRELSGGEQQRVALARALVNNPKVIIADEPTGNIDPEMSRDIIELFDAINRQGVTILMVTHDVALASKFNKRTVKLENGRIISDSGKAGDGR